MKLRRPFYERREGSPDEPELGVGEGQLGDGESGAELRLRDLAEPQQVEVAQELAHADAELLDRELEAREQVLHGVGHVVDDEAGGLGLLLEGLERVDVLLHDVHAL